MYTVVCASAPVTLRLEFNSPVTLLDTIRWMREEVTRVSNSVRSEAQPGRIDGTATRFVYWPIVKILDVPLYGVSVPGRLFHTP
jgi:hypothetical protein